MRSLILTILLALFHQALASMDYPPEASEFASKRRVHADESAHIYRTPLLLVKTWNKDLVIYIDYRRKTNPSLGSNSIEKIAKDIYVRSFRDAINTRKIKLANLRDRFGRSVLYLSLDNSLLLQVIIEAAHEQLPKILFTQAQCNYYSELSDESILHYYAQHYFGHHDDDTQIRVAKILLRAVVSMSLDSVDAGSLLLKFINLKHKNESAVEIAKKAKNIVLTNFLENIIKELEQGLFSQVLIKLNDLPW